MIDIREEIQTKLDEHLSKNGFDVLDLVAVPQTKNRVIQFKTLQDALNEFDESGDSVSYLIRVKSKKSSAANQDQKVEDPETVRTDLDQIYEQDGTLNEEYLLDNGRILIGAKEYALAKNIYRTLLNSGECNSEAYLGLGICFEGEGNVEEANKCFEESIAYRPGIDAYEHLISNQIAAGKNKYAIELIERALQLNNLSDDAKFELHKAGGNTWLRLKDVDQAKKYYVEALRLKSSADEIYSNLGLLYYEGGKTTEAMRLFRKALSINEKNDKALIGCGCCMLKDGNKSIAFDYFVRALEIEVKNPDVIFHLVACAFDLKRYAEAEKIVSRYVSLAPVNVNLLFSLAGLQYHGKKYSEALETTKNVLRLREDHPGANHLMELLAKRQDV